MESISLVVPFFRGIGYVGQPIRRDAPLGVGHVESYDSGAAEAGSAIQALVAGAVPDGDAAASAGRCIAHHAGGLL